MRPVPQKAKSANRKLDVWAQGRHEQTGGATQEGNALTTFMGADYRVDRDVLIGGMFQVDEAHQGSYAAAESAKGTAYMAGPYVAYRLTPHLQLDANAAWGLGQDTTTTGNWGWRGWQLSQTGAVTYLDETGNGLGGVPGTSVDIARLSVGPEVKRRFGTRDMSIEPFAFFKSSVDLSDAGLTDPNALNKVGGGVTLAKPHDYSIKATADYSESTGSTDPGVTQGKVSVSVPTSVLGF